MGGYSSRSKPPPKAWLRVEVLKCTGLHLPAEPGIDKALRSASASFLLNFTSYDIMHLIFPYVEVSLGNQNLQTNIESVVEGDDAQFTEPLFFPLNAVYLQPDSEMPDLRFTVKHKIKKPKLWRSDLVFGKVTLKTTTSSSVAPIDLQLDRMDGSETECTLTVKYSVINLNNASQILSSSRDFPLAQVIAVIMSISRGPDGVNRLLRARPQQLMSGSESSARSELEELVEGLSDQMVDCEQCSDAEMVQRLGVVSRALLFFVERFRSEKHADVVALASQWIRNLFVEYVQSSASLNGGPVRNLGNVGLGFNEERLNKVFSAAKVQVQNLDAVDEHLQVVPMFRKNLETTKSDSIWWSASKLVPFIADSSVLGIGTFGCVWRAKDRHTGKLFAIKNVTVPAIGSFRDMIAQRELELLNRICMARHPCVVELFFAGQSEEHKLYVHVMEFCPGGDLASKIKRARSDGWGSLPLASTRPWIGQLFLALEYLHLEAQVLHRDIKPANVVFSEQETAKLTDFGISQAGVQSDGDWTFGMPPGSPFYIAPEVFSQKEYDCKADFYSFGVMIWLILTGGLIESGHPPLSDNLADNWRMLLECIQDPAAHSANPMPSSDAADLVTQLTRPDADARPSHEALRKHPFMQPLDLPDADANIDVVSQWVDSQVVSFTHKTLP